MNYDEDMAYAIERKFNILTNCYDKHIDGFSVNGSDVHVVLIEINHDIYDGCDNEYIEYVIPVSIFFSYEKDEEYDDYITVNEFEEWFKEDYDKREEEKRIKEEKRLEIEQEEHRKLLKREDILLRDSDRKEYERLKVMFEDEKT